MKNLIIFDIILLIIALNCEARAPVQLSGYTGKVILKNMANITINQKVNASTRTPGDLWSWGTLPIGYALNESGKLVKLPSEGEVEWLPGI